MPFGKKLRYKRKKMGLTQEGLAARLNQEITRQTVSKWEIGPCAYPQVDTLLTLSVILDISLDELFADELSYLQKGNRADKSMLENYPGMVSGLKKLAEAINNNTN